MNDEIQNTLMKIDFQPAADVLNNIIDKVSTAVGWLAVPRGVRKDRETAVESYIESIKNDSSLPPLVKAQKISHARRDIKEYCNLVDFLEHAAVFGEQYNNLSDEPLDEDWAMFFCDNAKNISRDDVKVLWGKILSEECRVPGTIPKQLVHILSMMSKEDAELFSKVCGFCVNRYENELKVESNLLVFYGDVDGLVEKQELNSVKIFSLQALGLLSIHEDAVLWLDPDETYGKFEYHGQWIRVYQKGDNKGIRVGEFVLTKPGQVLADIIHAKPLPEFMEYVSAYYTKNGHRIEIV